MLFDLDPGVASIRFCGTGLVSARGRRPFGSCLLVPMMSPVVTIVGHETVGHRHQADVIGRLERRVAAR